MGAVDQFIEFYASLDQNSIAQLPNIYAPQTVLIDPVSSHQGIEGVTRYFKNLLENTKSCKCEVLSVLSHDNQHTLTWTMTYAHPKLNGGKEIKVDGITQLVIEDGLVVRHRDYFDLGQMLYEHIPIIGFVLKKFKKRLNT